MAEAVTAADSINTTTTIACFCHSDCKVVVFFFICRSCFKMEFITQRVSSQENIDATIIVNYLCSKLKWVRQGKYSMSCWHMKISSYGIVILRICLE